MVQMLEIYLSKIFLDAIASLLSTQECPLLTFLKNQLMQQLMILIDLT